MSSAKGSAGERELTNGFDDAGWAVIRAPASGGATQRELPDVLAGNGDSFIATEAKSSSGDPIYLTDEEVDGLCYFAQNFGAEPRISVRFNEKYGDPTYGVDGVEGIPWYFFRPEDCHRTPGGNYRVKKETALEKGVPFAEVVRQ